MPWPCPSRGSTVREFDCTRLLLVRKVSAPTARHRRRKQQAIRLKRACIKLASKHSMSTVTAQRNEVDSRRKSLGGKHPDTLGAVSQLGLWMLRNAGQLHNALPLLRREAPLGGRRDVLVGNKRPHTLDSITSLAVTAGCASRRRQASPCRGAAAPRGAGGAAGDARASTQRACLVALAVQRNSIPFCLSFSF